jgi:hypothetical protein
LFTHFFVSTVSHFSFLDLLAPLAGMMRLAPPPNAFLTHAIQFEDAKGNQSNGGDSFKLSLCASVTVSLMVM